MGDRGISSERRRSLGIALFAAVFLLLSLGDRVTTKGSTDFTVSQDSNQSVQTKTAAGLKIFRSDVRLLLAHKCVKCHGGDDTESDFDLTTRKGLLRGGTSGKAIVPGNAKKSRLVKLIRHQQEPKMPEEAGKLTDAEIAKIVSWIDLGAPYDKPLLDPKTRNSSWTERVVSAEARKYWAFEPIETSSPPQVKQTDWCRTDYDRFVLARLEEKGLMPNRVADRRTLIRRVYFDLIGLPPSPQQVTAFVNDSSPVAYEQLIDRLLDHPGYGERWARHWLDVARFAESHGFEHDYDRKTAYHYRDFVIKALNQDMPYDRFVQWQLAGDEMAPDDPLALTATGFLGAGVFPTQITANEVERTRYDSMDDMAATMGTAMLGLTIGCARCHDHKFDPIPSADYYRILSTFTTTVRTEIDLELDREIYASKKAAFDKQHAPLVAELEKYEKEKLPGQFFEWENGLNGKLPQSKWQVLDLVEYRSAGGATLTKLDDLSLLASGKNPAFDTYTLVARISLKSITAIRLEALADKSMVRGGPGRASNGNIALSDLRVTASVGKEKPVTIKLQNAKATFQQPGLSVAFAIDNNKKSAWAVDPQFGKNHAAVFETVGEASFTGEVTLTITLKFANNTGHNIGRPRLSITSAPRPVGLKGEGISASISALLKTPRTQRTKKQASKLIHWYRDQDSGWQALNRRVSDHLAKAPKPKRVRAMICSEGLKPMRHHSQGADFFEETFFLSRGDTAQKQGVATQGFLQVLMRHSDKEKHWQVPPPEGSRTSFRRTSLARWIVDTNEGAGHLLARVIVNRLWQQHFGRGIVATPNDFGRQGIPPSHPQLLDRLASDLIAGGWRLKPIHKKILLSATYRQSAIDVTKKRKVDPQNILLWRRTPRRLEAEAIRDSMLAVSKTLDSTMFGPGTLNETNRRRSIYFTVKRSKLIPMMQLFDAPEALVSLGGRGSTTIAPQALLFMNNPQVLIYAREFAGRLTATYEKSPAEAIRQSYLIALGRPPSSAEAVDAAEFLHSQIKSYNQAAKSKPEQLALADFCQVLMSLNEFIYIE